MKKAFTLIELLVVIAIIAILAAILFPVFAQAKLAAKKASSLSNVKEVGLAEIMYQGDSDDYFMLGNNGNDSLGTTLATQLKAGTAQNWPLIVQPYLKNYGILIDPGTGDPGGFFVGGQSTDYTATNGFYNQERYVSYGYNYMFLSPWYDCVSSLGRSSSQAKAPADTVMFTTSQAFTTAPQYGYYQANPPGAWPITAPAPYACIRWDGTKGSGNWSANNGSVGKITSSTRAVKPYGGANVVWVDGHAKFVTDGYLAQGTDYGTATYSNSNDGAQILDATKYKWTLDGTLNDLSF